MLHSASLRSNPGYGELESNHAALGQPLSVQNLGYRLIMPQPDPDCGEFDESEVVCGVFLVLGCDGAVVLVT